MTTVASVSLTAARPEARAKKKDTVGDLLVRIAQGDQWAFVELYDALAPRALGIASRVIVDRQFAEDVVQEVFLEIWQKAARFDSAKGNGTSWVLGLARNRAIDRVRSEQSSRDRDLEIGSRDFVLTTPDASESAEASELRTIIDRALKVLPEAQRHAVALSYAGLTHTQIAAETGVPVGTVKSRLRVALIRLREEMGVESAATIER